MDIASTCNTKCTGNHRWDHNDIQGLGFAISGLVRLVIELAIIKGTVRE